MIWTESKLRESLSVEAEAVRVPPPTALLERNARRRRALHRLGTTSALTVLAALVAAAPIALHIKLDPATTPLGPAAANPLTAIEPVALDPQVRDQLMNQCTNDLDHIAWAPVLAVRYPDKIGVVARGADDNGVAHTMLCEWDAQGRRSGMAAIGEASDGQAPVHQIVSPPYEAGIGMAVYSGVFRVADEVGSVTVTVNGGQPHVMALVDGFGYVAASSGQPELELPDSEIIMIAYDHNGTKLWTGRLP